MSSPHPLLHSLTATPDAEACLALARHACARLGAGARVDVGRTYRGAGPAGPYVACAYGARGLDLSAPGSTERAALEALVGQLDEISGPGVD